VPFSFNLCHSRSVDNLLVGSAAAVTQERAEQVWASENTTFMHC